MWCFFSILVAVFYLSCFASSSTLSNLHRNHLHTSTPKLSLADSAEWTEYHVREPEGPGTYSFGYDVEDSYTGNVQFRTEERRSNGTVQGSYGYVSPEGNVYVVHYVADHLGYRTKIEESKRIRSPNENYKSLEASQGHISPPMIAAFQSLENHNKFQKEEQRVRPIDQVNSHSPNLVSMLGWPVKENHQKQNNVYNVYYVPSN